MKKLTLNAMCLLLSSGLWLAGCATDNVQQTISQDASEAAENSAEKSKNIDMQAFAKFQDKITYVCDDESKLTVSYALKNGEPTATIYSDVLRRFRFDVLHRVPLTIDERYSENDNPVYTNEHYLLSVGTPIDGQLKFSVVYSLLDIEADPKGQVILQNCQVENLEDE